MLNRYKLTTAKQQKPTLQDKEGDMKPLGGLLFFSLLFGTLLGAWVGPAFCQGIIIDHTCTDLSQIPDVWINQVKSTLKVHYAHTSQGEQITVGLERLSSANPKYAYYPDNCSMPETSQYLSLMDGQYIYDYCETYVTPDLYWEGNDALDITRFVLDSFDVNISGWAWCTQLDHYSASETQAYLNAMSQLESEYPGIKFIYMTGNAQSAEQNRYDRNNQIRQYCQNNNKILFDFADLDSWYNGEQYLESGIPMEHPHYYGDEAGHTTFESCENKARAFWWLLARMAGWNPNAAGIQTDLSWVRVPEGGTAQFHVRLTNAPAANVTVSVVRSSGDSDLSVQSGAALTFTPANWNVYQTITLAAAEDIDQINGLATIRLSTPSLPNKDISAQEMDNDRPMVQYVPLMILLLD